jgi:antirestriction protein ArdC
VNRDIYQTITERFIAQLKTGMVPWQKPCLGVQNIVSRKPYHGINASCWALPTSNRRFGSR